MQWTDERKAELRQLWKDGGTITTIARQMNTTRGSISGASMRLHLHFGSAEPNPILRGSAPDVNATTRYYSHVQQPRPFGVLKPGSYQRKLGSRITKSRWKGMPIFSLTLEERATCPRSCRLWLTCYGNSMGRSVRYAHGAPLVHAIHADLTLLQELNPHGFVVRLHILGDFFSVEYVTFWRYMLDEFPALRVFGYTARQKGKIAEAINDLRAERWERFAVRTSGAHSGPRTKVIRNAEKAGDAIICPAQTGKTDCCGTCGLCWQTKKPIAFLQH